MGMKLKRKELAELANLEKKAVDKDCRLCKQEKDRLEELRRKRNSVRSPIES